MTTFTWQPAPGGTQAIKPRVRTAQFGDGYQQRVGDGINTLARSWSLNFDRTRVSLDQVEAFLRARAGVESFDWAPPTGAAGKWICAEWSRTAEAVAVGSLSATFTEVFGD